MRYLIICLFLFSCNANKDGGYNKDKELPVVRDENHTFLTVPVRTITYDGCEYVIFSNGNDTWGSHKGNCNNSIHKYK